MIEHREILHNIYIYIILLYRYYHPFVRRKARAADHLRTTDDDCRDYDCRDEDRLDHPPPPPPLLPRARVSGI